MAAIIKNPNPQGVEILDFHSIFVECCRLHRDHLPPRASAQLSLLHGQAGTFQVVFNISAIIILQKTLVFSHESF